MTETPLWTAELVPELEDDRDALEEEIASMTGIPPVMLGLAEAPLGTGTVVVHKTASLGFSTMQISEPADGYPVVKFKVPGIARPQGSKKAFVRGKHASMVETNVHLPQWRTDIGVAAEAAMGRTADPADGPGHPMLTGPLLLEVVFVFVRPASHFLPSGRLKKGVPDAPIGHNLGDLSKLVRAIEDAMEGIVYKDDCQFSTMGRPRKRWGLSAATYVSVSPDPLDP